MGLRHPNPRLVKLHHSYSVEEIARRLRVHKGTVRNWLKRGLTAIDEHRPILVLGPVLRSFLQARRHTAKQPCLPGQLYCVRCRAPKEPAGAMADYLPITATSGNLRGICPDCDKFIHRRANLSKLDQIKGPLMLAFPQGSLRIADSAKPSVNCDSGSQGARDEMP